MVEAQEPTLVAEGAADAPSWHDPERVFRDHADRIWRSICSSYRSNDIADEAVAETFAQLIRRGDGVRDPARWVWRSAFRIAAGLAHARNRTPVGAVREVGVEPPEPAWALRSALEKLSPMQRSSLVLHYYGGHPTKDIARMLSSTPAAVRVHLMRGRSRLRDLIGEDRP